MPLANRIILAALTLAGLTSAPAFAAEPKVDFNRDVRPILSNNCFTCHGPDEAERKADLRLDTFDGATAELDGSHAVVPGDASASSLLARITSADADEQMPPPESGKKKLTAQEVETLTRWIEQGATYAKHWSYVKPVRPQLPEVTDKSWPRNGVDHFILERLEKEGLTPSPEADKYALIRRVTLDITGLPPTL